MTENFSKTLFGENEEAFLGPDDPVRFTVGLELEFAVITEFPEGWTKEVKVSSGSSSNPFLQRAYYEDHLRQKLSERLNYNSVPTKIEYDGKIDFNTHWFIDYDNTISWKEGVDGPKYSLFDGTSIIQGPGEKLIFCQVEISSRILQYDKIENFSAVIEEVGRVVKTILEFDLAGATVTESCGLHMHVGQRQLAFPLSTLKNLLSLNIIGQYQIDEIHPPHRLSAGYAWPLSSILTSDQRYGSVWRIAQLIEMIPTVAEFIQYVHLPKAYKGTLDQADTVKDRSAAINFMNLGSRDKRTIEFRQHAGTLDIDVIGRWMLFLLSIMKICNTPRLPSAFHRVFDRIRRLEPAPDYHLCDFLKDLGLHEIAQLFEGHTFEHEYDPDKNDVANQPFDYFETDNTPTQAQTQGRPPWWIDPEPVPYDIYYTTEEPDTSSGNGDGDGSNGGSGGDGGGGDDIMDIDTSTHVPPTTDQPLSYPPLSEMPASIPPSSFPSMSIYPASGPLGSTASHQTGQTTLPTTTLPETTTAVVSMVSEALAKDLAQLRAERLNQGRLPRDANRGDSYLQRL